MLDVYTPANATASSRLPVKVWIYGGSNVAGGISDPTYTGCFSAVDSIVVSINYRLGPLGFLSVPEAGLDGNYAIQDILLALAWIQSNIAAFGGDPKRVLLFGQSAGAGNVFVLSTLPQAPSLFSAAAMQSGAGRDSPTADQVRTYSKDFVNMLGCSISDAACIRGVSLQALNETIMALAGNVIGAHTLFENHGHGGEWGAVVDGKVVPQQPSEVGVRVPSIIGSNMNEGTIFVLGKYGAAAAKLDASVYNDFLEWNFGPVASLVNKSYGLSRFSKSPAPVLAAMSTVITEYTYHCPASRALRTATSNKIPVWAYHFAHTPSCAWYQGIPTDPQGLQAFGPTHTAEIPFVFGLTSQLPPPGGNCSFSNSENSISEVMLGAWTSMAATGKPASSDAWPFYSPDKSLGLVVKDTAAAGLLNFTVCEFWDEVDAAVMMAVVNATHSSGGNDSKSAGAASATRGNAVLPVTLSTIIMLLLL